MKWLLPLAITICSVSFVSCSKSVTPEPTQTLTPTSQQPNEWEQTASERNKKPSIKPKPEQSPSNGGN